MSIATELSRIKTAKDDLIEELNTQGTNIDSTTAKIEDIPAVIDSYYYIPMNILKNIRLGYSHYTKVPKWAYKLMEKFGNNLPEYFFFHCTVITYVKLPANIKYIGIHSMEGMTNLEVIDYSNVTDVLVSFSQDTTTLNSQIGTSDWISGSKLKYIVVPDNLLDEYKNSSYYVNFKSYLISKSAYDAL